METLTLIASLFIAALCWTPVPLWLWGKRKFKINDLGRLMNIAFIPMFTLWWFSWGWITGITALIGMELLIFTILGVACHLDHINNQRSVDEKTSLNPNFCFRPTSGLLSTIQFPIIRQLIVWFSINPRILRAERLITQIKKFSTSHDSADELLYQVQQLSLLALSSFDADMETHEVGARLSEMDGIITSLRSTLSEAKIDSSNRIMDTTDSCITAVRKGIGGTSEMIFDPQSDLDEFEERVNANTSAEVNQR